MPIGWQGNSVFNNEGAKQTAGAILFESAGRKKTFSGVSTFNWSCPSVGRSVGLLVIPKHPLASLGLVVCWLAFSHLPRFMANW